MTKLKSTIKVGLHPTSEHLKSPDYSFVFSDDIRDWQRNSKKAYRERKANKNQ